jgi:geranylgeranyl pyrophosphate synthase/predicted secreted hydrolase
MNQDRPVPGDLDASGGLGDVAPRDSGFPDDWPGSGAIDLHIQDLPHASSTTEWWYLNTHLTGDDGRAYALFAAFFALAIDQDEVTKENKYAYSVEWGLIDVAAERYVYDSVLDRSAPEVGLKRIDRNEGVKDRLFARAMREVFERGAVPLPDRMFENPPKVAWDRLALDFDGNRLEKRGDGGYELTLARQDGGTGCHLVFLPKKSVVRHGQDGVVRGSAAEHMFYYFTPSCDVSGTVTIGGCAVEARGRGWYDHEFGKHIDTPNGKMSSGVGWNWVAAQLDDDSEVSLYQLFDCETGKPLPESCVIAVAPDGRAERIEEFTLTPRAEWTSTRTFNSYPTRWSLEVPKLGLSVTLEAEFGAQEFITIISAPAFWEGRIRIAGTRNDKPIAGLGFVERSGFSRVDTIDSFFSAVGQATRDAIRALLPDAPSREHAQRLFGVEGREYWVDDVDLEQYWRTVVQPVREIVERGGKTWRSYGLLACIDVVGGDSNAFRDWLALPELLHVGSLIIDDVQDGSDVRRGGPTVHRVHGMPLAINAGSACYFTAELPIAAAPIPEWKRVEMYRSYFAAVRAAHAGQGLDIDGLRSLMPDVAESGDGATLERRLRAIHRLKSAVPPSALARVAAILGDGTASQIEALANLFEAYGLAFQIVDDVLNLRGFEGDLKTRGEDLTEGKVTAPIAEAMSRLPLDQRRSLWATIDARPTDPVVLSGLIETLETCGALVACEERARSIVEEAWAKVDPLLVDSHVKTKLRAFGWFIIDRHY